MPYGYGFGFRGWSPPWPYVGRGRGGLPRCWYPGAWASWPGPATYSPYAVPFYGAAPAPWAAPYAPQMTREQELDFLKEEAEAVKEQLTEIEARIRELETKEGQS